MMEVRDLGFDGSGGFEDRRLPYISIIIFLNDLLQSQSIILKNA
jgi:hypothetical protein